MIKNQKILVIFIFVLFVYNSKSQPLEFVENKGQWLDNIAYVSNFNVGLIALKKDGAYRIKLYNVEELEAMEDFYHGFSHNHTNKSKQNKNNSSKGFHSHTYEVNFIGANKNPTVITDKPLENYNNYYLGLDSSKWASGCRIFQGVTFKNIYPNIDIRYYTNNGYLKYDFIIHKGGNPKNIIMQFEGVDNLKIKNGELNIVTSAANQKDLAPHTFQPTNEGKKIIDCQYKVLENLVTFSLDDYNKDNTLIIDPTMVFSTLSGSRSDHWGFTATYDEQGNFYGGGIVFGDQFQSTNGSSFQGGSNDSDEGGSYDIAIIKFNSTGQQRLYSTYIGGSGNDQPHSLVTNVSGDLFISGRTNSLNYPATFPKAGVGGRRDIIITRLNSLGNIVASRVIGGSADDGLNIKPKYSDNPVPGAFSTSRNYGDDARSEILLDNAGNVMLASCTHSTDFYVTPNAFQTTNGGSNSSMLRKQDAVFIKLNQSLNTFIVSSYLGGSNDDAAFVLTQNPINGNIYIAGATASSDFPGDKTNSVGTVYNGGTSDGFISILNSSGTQLIKTCYFGTSQDESIFGIQFDKKGFLYFTGTTRGNWPIINATYFNTGAKQFISKITSDFSTYIYSTVFGTNSSEPNISPTAFLVDRCENVYVSGWGGMVNAEGNFPNSGTNGLPITTDAIQKTTDGSDFYFFVLERDAKSQLYGSFFGQNGGIGEHVDGGTSRFDKNGIIYQTLCANCGGTPKPTFPTTGGAFSQVNPGPNCNLGAIKILLDLSGLGAGLRSSIRGVGDTSGCVPLTIKFQDTLAQGQRYIWDFGDGSPVVTTKKPDTSHTFTRIGSFKVCLVSIDSSKCNVVDTSCRTMRIRSDSSKLNLTYKKIGNCIDNMYQFDNTSSVFPPNKPFKNNSFVINFGDGSTPEIMGYQNNKIHQYPGAGTYKGWMTLVDTNYCNTPDTAFFEVEVVINVVARFTPPLKGCLSKPIDFVNTSTGAKTYLWSFGDGSTSTQTSPSHTFPTTGFYTIKLYAFNETSCNKVDSFIVSFEVSISPKSDFVYTPNPPQVNTPVTFINQSIGAVKYQWSFGDGDTIRTSSRASLSHLYQMSKVFDACLIVYNLFNCTDTLCKPIQARVNQLYDVPNAFTPNGDGKNDKIFVRGFGIRRINWQIYNRWGALIFTSNNIEIGWDGKYKNEIQPQEVYHYTLTVEFWDGTRDSKSGDITLLR